MVKRTRIWVGFVLLVLIPLTGCTGADSPDDARPQEEPVTGSFVGKVEGSGAFVAVVAAPAADGDGAGVVHVHVSDGRGRGATLSGTVSGDTFTATSEDGGAEAEGTLTRESVSGTVTLPGVESGSYEATPPSGAAGVYELTVSPAGDLTGASAAGLVVTGEMALARRGTGKVRLVDGRRLELAVTRTRADLALRAGQVRLIVLEDGEVRGLASSTRATGPRSHYVIRSS